MAVILSMKTFQRLEQKLGSEAAKEVYELAEAIYEELDRKVDVKFEQINDLTIKEIEQDYINKSDLLAFRKEVSGLLANFKEEQGSSIRHSIQKFGKSFSRVTLLLIINMIFILVILGYLIRPLLLNGG